ncbi:MAG: CoA transferase, partial [Firmicutes bacterium]|nr:CoA transferase [Bacillota bacterium]
DQVVEDPQAWESDIFAKLDYPSGPKAMTRTPVMFENAGLPDYKKGPTYGGNTNEILSSIGFTAEDIDSMRGNGEIQ